MDPLEALDFSKNDGLVTAVALDDATGDPLMVAFMNEESFRQTLATGQAVYWSRSRSRSQEGTGYISLTGSWGCETLPSMIENMSHSSLGWWAPR